MSLFVLIILQLFLEVKTQDLPQAKLTVSPPSVNNGEMVHMVCGGFENRAVSECMFYPSGQENFTMPIASCNLSITGMELIVWSQDKESSYVNIKCHYTVVELGRDVTSPPSEEVSVEITSDVLASSRLAAPLTVSPISDYRSTLLLSRETSQADVQSTMSTPSKPATTASSLQSTTSTNDYTKPEGPKFKKFSNRKMLFSFVMAVNAGGLVFIGFIGICMHRCTRRQRTGRIWIESIGKNQAGVSLPMVGSDSCCEEEAEFYSSVTPRVSEPSGNYDEQSKQTQVELNPLYYTIFTEPACSDSGDIYSVPMSRRQNPAS